MTVNEGQTAANSGTYSDADSGDNVALSASVGTITKTGTNSGTWSWSYTPTDGPAQSQTVTITANDGRGGVSTTTFSLTVNNVAPTAIINPTPASSPEGTQISLSSTVTDPGTVDTHTYAWSITKDGGPYASVTPPSFSFTPADNGTYVVNLTVTDKDGGVGTADSKTITVTNVAPEVTINPLASIDPRPVGAAVSFSGSFTDRGTLDTHTAQWSFTSAAGAIPSTGGVTQSNGSGSVSGSHTFATPGVYQVRLTVTDDDGGSGTATLPEYLVIYDPSASFVTGGGWINSPAGAYVADPTLTGRASFGFVARYRRGATVPEGNTQFQFQAGNLNFHSTSYEWLVVAGARAQFKGAGTINGAGSYGFMLTAIDGQRPGGGGVDRFRIKIWNKTTGNIIYDNQVSGDTNDNATPNTIIGGGSIVIHDS